MRGTAAAAAALLILLGGCGREKASQPAADPLVQLPQTRNEAHNLMAMLNGAVVTDRSGEAGLETAAILSIDSTLSTVWMAEPGLRSDWMVTELPALSEIRRVVVSTGAVKEEQQARKISFEASVDGKSYRPLATVTLVKDGYGQTFDVSPSPARFIRARLLQSGRGDTAPAVASLGVEGRELEARRPTDISGVWKINQFDAELAQVGSRIFGIVRLDPPMIIAGDLHDGYGRFAWVRTNQAGYGILSANPSGDALNAVWWHERPLELFFGESWYGRRTRPATGRIAEADVEMIGTSLQQIGVFPLYGVNIDVSSGRVLEGLQTIQNALAVVRSAPDRRFAFVAYGWGHGTEAENLALSRKRIDTLRKVIPNIPANLTFDARGSSAPPRCDPARNPQNVKLYDRLDLELLLPPGEK